MILNIHIEHNPLKHAESSQVEYISPAGERIYHLINYSLVRGIIDTFDNTPRPLQGASNSTRSALPAAFACTHVLYVVSIYLFWLCCQ